MHNINGIYQVYTWYIPCINLSYDNVKYIPDIYHKKLSETFRYLSRDSLDPPYTKYKQGINLVYTMSKLSRDRYRNVSESFAWCMSGINLRSSYERFMHGIYQVYTWYILLMISYDWYMFSIFHLYLFLCSKSMTCLDETFTFGLGITFIGAPVFFWIFSAWMGMRFQARQCVQQRSARRAGVLRHECLIRMLYFHFETPRKFGRRSLQNAGGCSTGMERRAIAAKLRYVISFVKM